MKKSQYGTVFTSYTTSTPLKKLKKEIAKKRKKEKIKSQNVQHDQ
jgi:sulfur relay (sulfurtransferase) DsrC/TusE family protein